jgi:hypothetical protein
MICVGYNDFPICNYYVGDTKATGVEFVESTVGKSGAYFCGNSFFGSYNE